MTRIYQATDGTSASSISGNGTLAGTPWDTGRTGVSLLTRPSTREIIYNNIVAALVAAGWTQYVKNATAGSQDNVFESDGEDGTANLCIRVQQQTSGRYIYFYVAPKLDSSNDLVQAIGGQSSTADRWDLTSSNFTADMQILATKDYIWVVTQNINHTSSMFCAFLGNLETYFGIPTILATSGAVSAGSFVEIATTVDPHTAGYRMGDTIQILEVAKAGSALTEYCTVAAVSATSVTVRRLQNSYSAGAKLGTHPCPIVKFVGANTQFQGSNTPTNLTSPFLPATVDGLNTFASGSFPSGAELNALEYALQSVYASTGDEYGTATTPNDRTLRFTCRTMAVGFDGAACGQVLPGIIAYNGTPSFYPHDYRRADRLSSLKDYVPMRFTATGTLYYLLGPTAGS